MFYVCSSYQYIVRTHIDKVLFTFLQMIMLLALFSQQHGELFWWGTDVKGFLPPTSFALYFAYMISTEFNRKLFL